MKGVSPLIATVLLIAFTITIAILVVSWGSAFVTQTTSGIGNRSTDLVDCSGAAIDIDSVYVSSNTINILVKNSGIRVISVTSVSASNTSGTIWVNSANLTSVTSMTRGSLGTITIPNVAIGVNCSSLSRITVASVCPGIAAEWTKTPTSCT